MRYLKQLALIFGKLFRPIQVNATFFTFMYLLGVLGEVLTLPKGQQLYDNLWLELFLDLYLVCLVLTALPRRWRKALRMVCYILAYSVSLADVYCYTNYDSTLSPSMLLLVGETDGREAGEFLSSIFSGDFNFLNISWVLLLMGANIVVALLPVIARRMKSSAQTRYLLYQGDFFTFFDRSRSLLGLVTAVLLIVAAVTCADNKGGMIKIFSEKNVGQVEHTLTYKDHAHFYTPLYRLAFSIYMNHLAAGQIDQLVKAAGKARVDSCDYKSPTIVLIIGESYGRHHSRLYGYFKDTTPRQVKLRRQGWLTRFSDVVSCWNLTSFVFKNVFSMHVVGQKGEWCDYPLFTELFRKAGYQVTFLTNQFLPRAHEAVYDFSGGFFLNNPQLAKEQFDIRNTRTYQYDDGLLHCYDSLSAAGVFNNEKTVGDSAHRRTVNPNLVIFHLLGQHVTYKTRYPHSQTHFWASSYEQGRPNLTDRQRKVLSQYDNACLYNDSIVDQIIRRFSKKNAIVIYMPDHGEECYEENRGFICRNHSAAIDWPLAHYEFEVPFWIYCSPQYVRSHRDVYRQVRNARDRRFMTDALPHMLMSLAGIHTPYYHAQYDLLSPDYNEHRPRILKGTADYDKLRDAHYAEKNKNKNRKERK